MKKIKSEIYFGSEALEDLLDELIKEKIKKVTQGIKNGKNGDSSCYNKDYSFTNNSTEKVNEIR